MFCVINGTMNTLTERLMFQKLVSCLFVVHYFKYLQK